MQGFQVNALTQKDKANAFMKSYDCGK